MQSAPRAVVALGQIEDHRMHMQLRILIAVCVMGEQRISKIASWHCAVAIGPYPRFGQPLLDPTQCRFDRCHMRRANAFILRDQRKQRDGLRCRECDVDTRPMVASIVGNRCTIWELAVKHFLKLHRLDAAR